MLHKQYTWYIHLPLDMKVWKSIAMCEAIRKLRIGCDLQEGISGNEGEISLVI